MKTPAHFLIAIFLAMLASAPLVQTVAEARRGKWPAAFEIFRNRPDPASLHAFERRLQDDSLTAQTLRPWMQAAQFFAIRDAGQKVLVGKDGWLFYQPGVNAVTQRPRPGESTTADALAAAIHFRDSLSVRGIRLIVVPVPNKESVYPDQLVSCEPPQHIPDEQMRAFFDGCAKAGVETVDLFAVYREARRNSTVPLFLKQDSHWSPAGMELAAQVVASRIGGSSPGTYDRRTVFVARHGDLVQMLRSPVIESRLAPEAVTATQIYRRDTGALYADDTNSDILVLGDSFLRIFEQDEPGGAGFIAHLAERLGRPVSGIVNDGGASTLVRQELYRRPQLLAKTRVVVWEFVERDLRLGMEGWQLVPLPPETATGRPSARRSE